MILTCYIPGADEPLSDYSETERKMFFRQKLLPIVEQMCPRYSVKVNFNDITCSIGIIDNEYVYFPCVYYRYILNLNVIQLSIY